MLIILEIIVTIMLIASVLLQSQGSGLSQAFGGGGGFYRSKRSVEKLLMIVTIILGTIFALLSVLLVIF